VPISPRSRRSAARAVHRLDGLNPPNAPHFRDEFCNKTLGSPSPPPAARLLESHFLLVCRPAFLFYEMTRVPNTFFFFAFTMLRKHRHGSIYVISVRLFPFEHGSLFCFFFIVCALHRALPVVRPFFPITFRFRPTDRRFVASSLSARLAHPPSRPFFFFRCIPVRRRFRMIHKCGVSLHHEAPPCFFFFTLF